MDTQTADPQARYQAAVTAREQAAAQLDQAAEDVARAGVQLLTAHFRAIEDPVLRFRATRAAEGMTKACLSDIGRDAVSELRKTHLPSDIGDMLGIARQRVQQLLRARA